VLCCWALMLVRIAEYRTGTTWRELRQEMDRMHVGRVEGLRGTLWRRTETRAFPAPLFKALRMSEPPVVFHVDPPNGDRRPVVTRPRSANSPHFFAPHGVAGFYVPTNCRTRVSRVGIDRTEDG